MQSPLKHFAINAAIITAFGCAGAGLASLVTQTSLEIIQAVGEFNGDPLLFTTIATVPALFIVQKRNEKRRAALAAQKKNTPTLS